MPYFIDTNVFVAALRGRAPQVLSRFLTLSPREIFVPFQVLAELKLGAAKSARPAFHEQQVNLILQPFTIVWPDARTVEHYVNIRGTLEKAGAIIGEADLWIAAVTVAGGGILVTNNISEFSRVPALHLEDWLV